MFDWRSRAEWKQLWRYYQTGIVNTLFGYGLFSLLIWLGLNVYVAQVLAHVLGSVFNYFTYSRYAFAGRDSGAFRFVVSYLATYLMSFAVLAMALHVIASPYLAALVTTVIVSVVNYFVLKRLVFTAPPQ